MEAFREDGERGGECPCYRDFCPRCDAPVSVADEVCPDCGMTL